MPDASYVLPTEDKAKVMRVLKSLTTLWKVSNKSLVGAVIRLSRVFKKLCAKTVNGEEKEQLLTHFAELCAC